MSDERATWDGVPIAKDPPHGALIVVYRELQGDIEYLLLHRAHSGPDFHGDWAWTPPAGARQPGEAILDCAVRELREETGLVLPLQATDFGTPGWYVYVAMMDDAASVVLDAEHDRFEWVGIAEASRCRPDFVAAHIYAVHEALQP